MSQALYTKEQILDAERVSWARPRNAEVRYSYDGISFWRHRQGGVRTLTHAEEVPASGWRHREGCNCKLCREAYTR